MKVGTGETHSEEQREESQQTSHQKQCKLEDDGVISLKH